MSKVSTVDSNARDIARRLDRIYDTYLTNDLVRVLSSPSYTLDELEQLGKDYCDTSGLTENDRVISILVLSLFIQWARKREREVGG